jgi:hypothetical protein
MNGARERDASSLLGLPKSGVRCSAQKAGALAWLVILQMGVAGRGRVYDFRVLVSHGSGACNGKVLASNSNTPKSWFGRPPRSPSDGTR